MKLAVDDMYFESLANELILDIFEYFNSIELLQAFHGLNIHFNELLYHHLERFPLDFRSVSKQDFDRICQQHLPLITSQITSLRLSNDDDTPQLPQIFLSYGFQIQQFTKLQSLSLYHIHSIDLLNRILFNCSHLISLNISKFTADEDDERTKIELCINSLWKLPQLRHCHLDMSFDFPLSIEFSSSIQSLSFGHKAFRMDQVISLFRSTPNLQTLNIRIKDRSEILPILLPMPLLTKLTIDFQGSIDLLGNLLRNMPNLARLIIEINHILIGGCQWETLINHCLPRLKIFRLSMYYKYPSDQPFDEEIDQLSQSFQTKFWLERYQCAVRCDYHTQYRTIHFYTLPYGFQKFSYLMNYMSKSVATVSKTSDYANIRHLELSFPFDESLWRNLSKFHRLTSLEVVSATHSDENNRSLSNLCLLLNQAKYLSALTIDYLILSQLSAVTMTNQSIYRLNLIAIDGHFYGLECIPLIKSVFHDRCEVLLINLENRSIVLELIQQFPNLRALIFQCQDDQLDDSSRSLVTDDELLQWLVNRLPTTCSISRDEWECCAVRLWIR